MKNYLINYNLFFFDSICKFNIYNKNFFFNLNLLKIFVKINNGDNFFLKNFFILSKVFSKVFNRKLSILKVVRNSSKLNKTKNSLFFFFGLTFNNISRILYVLNYILNDISFISNKTDDSLKIKKFSYNVIFFFKNINYFLGLDFSNKFFD